MPAADLGYFNPADGALRKRVVRRRVLKILIIVGLAIAIPIVAIVTALLVWSHRFESNLAKANAHIPLIEARIASDSRFDDLQIVEDSHYEGSIGFMGLVRSQADLDALHQVVDSTSPPVAVHWAATVATSAQLERMKHVAAATAPASQP